MSSTPIAWSSVSDIVGRRRMVVVRRALQCL